MSLFNMVICRTCKFWDLFGEGYGLCRRHAPQVHMLNPEAVAKQTKLRIISPLQGLWPVVSAEDWCGDHECTLPAEKETVNVQTHSE